MSSKSTQEKYDLVKIEKLKHYLESANEKGKPKFYEIFVDNLKAVDKTSDPDAFDEYLVYMSEDTRMVKVLIYTSTESCPRNDKFLFTVTSSEKDEKKKQELSGIEIEEKIHSVVQMERDKMSTELMKKEIDRLKGELNESEEYIEELEKKLEETRALKATSKENLGEVFSIALENIVRRNTHLLGGIPLVGQGLAGIVEQDNKRLEETAQNSLQAIEERNASFKRKTEDEVMPPKNSLSKEDQETLNYFKTLRQTFSEKELVQIFEIICALSYDKESIQTVLELLSEEDEKENEEPSNQDNEVNSSEISNDDLSEKANQF